MRPVGKFSPTKAPDAHNASGFLMLFFIYIMSIYLLTNLIHIAIMQGEIYWLLVGLPKVVFGNFW